MKMYTIEAAHGIGRTSECVRPFKTATLQGVRRNAHFVRRIVSEMEKQSGEVRPDRGG